MSCSKEASLRRGLFISAQVTLIKASVRVGVLLRRFTSSHVSSQRGWVCGVTAEILINLETQMQLHRLRAQHACRSAGTACVQKTIQKMSTLLILMFMCHDFYTVTCGLTKLSVLQSAFGDLFASSFIVSHCIVLVLMFIWGWMRMDDR